jgi:oligopeptide transport system substrate-binding protein
MSSFRYWRLLLVSLLAITALLAFSACGDDDGDGGGDGETPGDETPADGGGERIQGGDLTVQSVEFASLDPHFSSFAQDISLHRMLWRGLYTLDIDNVPQPSMAESEPEVSADGLTYTVALREGLTWSDGDDLLAEDFVAGIVRTCNPTNAGEYQYVLTEIVGCDDYYGADPAADDLDALEAAVGVRAVDDTTIEFTLSTQKPTFPIILSLWMTFPVPVHIDRFANATPEEPGEWGTDPAALAYNGPYVLTAYSPQESVTLEPNPNWAAPAGVSPTLDSITIRFIDDLAQAANGYRTGELSSTDVDLTQLEQLRNEFGDGEEYFKFLTPSTRGLEMQVEKPPLDIFEFRLALSQSIDRDLLNETVAQGGNEPSTNWIPAVTGGEEPDAFDDDIGFDPAAAAENFAAAQEAFGGDFPALSILVGDSPSARATAEFLQEAFRTHLNYETNIEVVDSATRSDRFTEEQFDLFPGGWIQDYPDPENWVLGLFDTDGTLNHYNCSDPDIDALVADARANTDDEERRSQYKEINALISERLCGIAVYWHENNHWLIKPNVVGMRENLAGQDGAMPGDWAAEHWGLSE